jgi:5-methyltetrahydrofolate--homocysteine methyltransferase
MKKAVAYLNPFIEQEKGEEQKALGKILMATVKGDVHDIGKNIVSVVLGCNNYEIVDLGVMVPPEKIMEAAIKEKVDIIGLSGLITPSLDEMVYLAKEMERQDFKVPLLIGGATTSKAHTAVKIDTQYKNAVVHVNDASRAVTVVGDLLNKKTNSSYIKNLKEDYDEFRIKFLKRGKEKSYISLKEARKRKYKIDWKNSEIIKPKELGVQVLKQLSLKELLPFIDWSPFFRSWDLHGRFPDILTDEVVGEQATIMFNEAQSMIKEIIAKQLLKPKAVFGLYEANSINEDDISVQIKAKEIAVFRTLRQQTQKREGIPNIALADFIAPKDINKTDYMGAFCVTIFGAQELADSYKTKEDDYNAIMAQAIADRFAEAFAEYLHKEIRTKHWDYDNDEGLTNDDLIKESYKGIRPAPGYPACPDHLEKETIWEVLKVEENIGVTLTESLAMWPAASVSGYYFANKEAKYFGLGKITDDQVTDFANRKGITKEKAKKWLHPNLANQ